jgi:hypothetical protein
MRHRQDDNSVRRGRVGDEALYEGASKTERRKAPHSTLGGKIDTESITDGVPIRKSRTPARSNARAGISEEVEEWRAGPNSFPNLAKVIGVQLSPRGVRRGSTREGVFIGK